jgi:hypothetical protein
MYDAIRYIYTQYEANTQKQQGEKGRTNQTTNNNHKNKRTGISFFFKPWNNYFLTIEIIHG